MRGGAFLAVGNAGCAGSGAAEPWIDYDLLRKIHADQVVVATDADGKESWRLDMGDGVTVSCSEGGCVGMDIEGAVGCTFTLVADLKAFAEACHAPIPDAQRQRLDGLYERVGRFVAANSIPEQDWSELQGYSGMFAQRYREEIADRGPEICVEATAPDSDYMRMLEALSSPWPAEASADFDRLLSKPRLPVMNPCL